MIGGISGLLPELAGAGAIGAIGAIGGFVRWLVTRHGDAVTELRKALDRGLRRENALATVCELQIFLINGLDDPPPQVAELRDRCREVLEMTQRQIYGGQT